MLPSASQSAEPAGTRWPASIPPSDTAGTAPPDSSAGPVAADETPLGLLHTRLYELDKTADPARGGNRRMIFSLPGGGTFATTDYWKAPNAAVSKSPGNLKPGALRPLPRVKEALLVMLPETAPDPGADPAPAAPPPPAGHDASTRQAAAFEQILTQQKIVRALAMERLMSLIPLVVRATVALNLGRNSPPGHIEQIVDRLVPVVQGRYMAMVPRLLGSGDKDALKRITEKAITDHFDPAARDCLGPDWNPNLYRFRNNALAGIRRAHQDASRSCDETDLSATLSYFEKALFSLYLQEDSLLTPEAQSALAETARQLALVHLRPGIRPGFLEVPAGDPAEQDAAPAPGAFR